MPLAQDTPIVTAGEVAELTHEEGLDNLNGTDATITNSCKWATNVIIPKLKLRGIQPEKVSNVGDLKVAAGYLAASLALGSLPDREAQERADKYEKKGLAALAEYQFESTESGKAQNLPPRGLPRTLHVDSRRVFNRPTDTRDPFDPFDRGERSGYLQKG